MKWFCVLRCLGFWWCHSSFRRDEILLINVKELLCKTLAIRKKMLASGYTSHFLLKIKLALVLFFLVRLRRIAYIVFCGCPSSVFFLANLKGSKHFALLVSASIKTIAATRRLKVQRVRSQRQILRVFEFRATLGSDLLWIGEPRAPYRKLVGAKCFLLCSDALGVNNLKGK